MSSEKFFQSRTAIITLFAACLVVLISLGVRQTFGLFFMDFNESLKISNTAFGFAIGVQMLMWGLTGPIFGAIADKYGGHVAIISAFIFYTAGIFFLYTGPNTGIFFQAEDGIRDPEMSRGLGDVYKRQVLHQVKLKQQNKQQIM